MYGEVGRPVGYSHCHNAATTICEVVMVFIKIEALDRIRRLFEKPPRQMDAEMDLEIGRARRNSAQRRQSSKERAQPGAERKAAQADD